VRRHTAAGLAMLEWGLSSCEETEQLMQEEIAMREVGRSAIVVTYRD